MPHPPHLIEALVTVLVTRREHEDLASARRRVRRPTHEALVQKAIDQAYEEARLMRLSAARAES